jgi:hypothetical protein
LKRLEISRTAEEKNNTWCIGKDSDDSWVKEEDIDNEIVEEYHMKPTQEGIYFREGLLFDAAESTRLSGVARASGLIEEGSTRNCSS